MICTEQMKSLENVPNTQKNFASTLSEEHYDDFWLLNSLIFFKLRSSPTYLPHRLSFYIIIK